MGNEIYFLYIHFVLLLSIQDSLVAADTMPMTLPGCHDRCGEVQIPYPFGIGEGCYRNEWYQVLCNRTSNGFVAFLSKIQHEVLDISLPHDDYPRIVVNSRAISSGCSRAGGPDVVLLNLTGSPFVVSNVNSFTALGYCSRWLLTNVEPQVVGCQTTCNKTVHNERDAASCKGYKCCNASIPNHLQIFGANISNVSASRGCTLAFLNDGSFVFPSDVSRQELLRISNMSHPLVLFWGIDHVMEGKDNNTVKCSRHSFFRRNGAFITCRCRLGYRGNPYLPGACKDFRGKFQNFRPITLGVGLEFVLLFLSIGIWWSCITIQERKRTKLKNRFFKRNGGLLLQQRLSMAQGSIERTKIFSSEELDKATDTFKESRILGQGGQGTVYKGMLVDGKAVAVKKSKVVDEEKVEDFINEIVILSQINHRNIVKLLGCCLETGVPILVYEFIPNGNLFEHLRNPSDDFPMTWQVRLRIAIEIAGALYYLHSLASIPIYHRDVKSKNILLDKKYRSKISDFGISRSVPVENTHLTTTVIGTVGYMDPEYFQSNQFTAKSDVYSFGVVLVELLTGKKPVSVSMPDEGRTLATYFILSMEEGKLFDILDAQVLEECDREQLNLVANLARRCLSLNGKNRPAMKEVSAELVQIQSLRKASQVQVQNDKEANAVETDMIRSWSSVCTSTLYNSGTSSWLDMEPLVPHKTW